MNLQGPHDRHNRPPSFRCIWLRRGQHRFLGRDRPRRSHPRRTPLPLTRVFSARIAPPISSKSAHRVICPSARRASLALTACNLKATAAGLALAVAALILIGPWPANLALGLGLALIANIHAPTIARLIRAAILAAITTIVAAHLGLGVVALQLPSPHGDFLAITIRPISPASRGDLVTRWVHTSTGRTLTLDRVLAIAGDTLQVSLGVTTVNGHKVSPLGLLPNDLAFEHSIASGQLAVIPSLVRWQPDGPEPQHAINTAIEAATTIDSSHVVGRVLLLRRGAWRWSFLP